eukprot:Hpha_TRINITY_DN16125_c3_g7::TRINITY_DN16125_c3_g7_i1::g.7011::m.7011
MAYLSGVSDNRLEHKHVDPAERAKRREAAAQGQPLLTWTPEDKRHHDLHKLGISLQGQFEGSIRGLTLFDSQCSLDKLRVWTSERDGYIQIRKAATGARVNTIEKKDGAFVTSLAYSRTPAEQSSDSLPHEFVYVGYSDGFLRVYQKRTHTTLSLAGAKAGKTGLKFEDGSTRIKTVVPNSPADLAGFQDGQSVEAVNGSPVTSGREVNELIDKSRGLCELTVSLVRRVEDDPDSEEPDYELVHNVKKHNKEVLCMLFLEQVRIRGQTTERVLFTGGRDWQILLWKWDVRRRPPPGPNAVGDELWSREEFDARRDESAEGLRTQCHWHEGLPGTEQFRSFDGFTGSQNAVQCMTFLPKDVPTPGGCLYLGGDDFTIRCLDLNSGFEVAAPPDPNTGSRGFPITTSDLKHGHREGIKALAVNQKYLFSASKDGTVRVWEAERGYPVALGGRKSNALFRSPHGDAQLQLLLVNSDPQKEHGHLWSAGVDGVIRVWQAWGDPYGLYEVQPPEGQDSVVQWSSAAMEEPAQEPLQRGDVVYVADVGKGKAMRLKDGTFLDRRWLVPKDPPDEDGCFQAWLVAEMTEHRGAIIQNLGIAQRNVHGGMYWSAHAERDTIQMHYTKNDQGDQDEEDHKEGFSSGEQDLIGKVEELRDQLLANAVEMDVRKKHKELIERRDNNRKAMLQESFASYYSKLQKRHYYFRLLKFTASQKSLVKRKNLSDLLLRSLGGGLRMIYYGKLKFYTRVNRARKRREKFARSIMAGNDKTLQILYWYHLQHYMKRHAAARKRREVAYAVLANTSRGLLTIYYSRLKAFNFHGKQRKKKQAIADAMLAKSDKGLKIVYYNKMVNACKRLQALKQKQALADTLSVYTRNGFLRVSYGKWIRWSRQHKQGARRKNFAAALARGSEQFLVRLYNKKALDWAAMLRMKRLRQALGELDDQTGRLEDILKSGESMTEEEIDRAFEETERRIKELEEEIAALKVKINKQRDINSDLDTKLMMEEEPPEGTTMEQRIDWLVRRLKAHGVLCRCDMPEITHCRKDWTIEWKEKFKGPSRGSKESLTHAQAPAKLFENGIHIMRDSLGESWDILAAERGWEKGRPQQGKTWPLTTDVINTMRRELFCRCHMGVVRIVYAWDRMRSREKDVIYGQKFTSPEGADPAPASIERTQRELFESIKLEDRKEVDLNANWILYIATRMWDVRNGEAEFEGSPWRELSPHRGGREDPMSMSGSARPAMGSGRRTGSGRFAAGPSSNRSGTQDTPKTRPAQPATTTAARRTTGARSTSGAPAGSGAARATPSGSSGTRPRSGSGSRPRSGSGSARRAAKPSAKGSSAARRAPM